MATWQENLQAFDLLHQPLPNTGHQITDTNMNNLISQLATLRRAAETGFIRMEQTLRKLDKYDGDLKADLLSIRTELATTIEPNITMGAKMDNLANRANDIDTKFANAEQKLLESCQEPSRQLCCRINTNISKWGTWSSSTIPKREMS